MTHVTNPKHGSTIHILGRVETKPQSKHQTGLRFTPLAHTSHVMAIGSNRRHRV